MKEKGLHLLVEQRCSESCAVRLAILVVSMGQGRWEWRAALGTTQGNKLLISQLVGLARLRPFSFPFVYVSLKLCALKQKTQLTLLDKDLSLL